jgi:hypothetical protein
VVKWVAFLLIFWRYQGSNLGPKTGCFKVFFSEPPPWKRRYSKSGFAAKTSFRHYLSDLWLTIILESIWHYSVWTTDSVAK